MNIANLFFIILFILAVIYLFMGMAAYSHTINEERENKWLAISPWWAIYGSIYDEFGRKLSNYGRVILVIEIIGFVCWAIIIKKI